GVGGDPSQRYRGWGGATGADRARMANPEPHEAMRRDINEAFRHGAWGYVDDILCLIQPWGFDVTEIRAPTRILSGLTGAVVPRQHGEWLADNVPNAEAVIDERGGHMADPNPATEPFSLLPPPAQTAP